MRKLSILMAAALAAGCRTRSHENMVSPVRAFVQEARCGTADVGRYRAYVHAEVAEPDLAEWVAATRCLMDEFGSDARYRVVAAGEREAKIRVTMALPGEFKPGFDVWVEERSSGWWISRIEVETPSAVGAPPSGRFAVGGGSGRRRVSRGG